MPPNSEPDEQTPVLPVPDTEPEREGSAIEHDAPANRPHEPVSPSTAVPPTDAKPPRKTPVRRAPRTTTPKPTAAEAGGASSAPADAAAGTTADAAIADDSTAPVKPARSTTRAPRTPATPRATTTPRAPAKKKPITTALAEEVAAPPTTPVTPDADSTALNFTSAGTDADHAAPVTAAARVPVTRAPAARKTPVKAPSKATRLPATTTSTADTADAVEAAAVADQEQPAGSGEATPDKPKTAAARSSSARTAASKAAAARAAAAKTESATKAGAARAAATKAAAAKSAAARTAATASARAATAAAAAAVAARSAAADEATSAAEPAGAEPVIGASTTSEPTVAVPSIAVPSVAEPVVAEPVAEPVVDAPTVVLPVAQAAPAPADEMVDAPELAGDDETVVLTLPTSDADDTVVLPTASVENPVAEPHRPSRRPFWKLPRLALRQADAAAPAPAEAPAEPSEVVPHEEIPADAEPSEALTAQAPVTAAAPVVMAADTTRPGTAVPQPGVTATAQRIPPVVRKPSAPRTGASAVIAGTAPVEIAVSGLNKRFGQNIAVADVNLEVRAGSFYGIVGPNGAGKTTTLSMITGLLRPDSGSIQVHGVDVWADPVAAKRTIGVLPDRLRLFDRLTGAQLLYYSGVLRGLESETVRARSADLAAAFGLEDALNRLVADYSAGMTKKIALACAMIHSPRVLVLDEPFESVDPVSAVNVTEILQRYVAAGGTVILSSHGMDLIQRVCDHVAIIVQGSVLAAGTIDEVRGNVSLEERFVDLAGGRKVAEGLEWLHNFSD